jgi:diadenosine tetraphosphate (Ap4A) HIT family hydrolase
VLAQKNLGVQPSSCDPPVLASMPLPLFQAPTQLTDRGSLNLDPSFHIVTAIESEHAPNGITPILFLSRGHPHHILTMASCPFCAIAKAFPPSSSPSPNYDLTSPSAHVILSTSLCMAFLDIMPLSPGHLLVTTRKHHEKISDVTDEESRELGEWLPRLSRVLANVTGVWDWNIVQNNGSFFSI